ncbi:precorrin 3B synthase CobZ [Cyphellophora europaea CBS 101466]|uniref:Precorrin 3B synthase CobZ n=1 Tax=Cyphellophora europaea (strain CBS 101466) TaxID=1220924 RepID=W2RS87_CYPE1|nr:precorrin 3B synthase CobZ [Cyphellophora europaea CBS 101466]ETN39317.1 precorrin 3B synthase CobZ [Cyphellophora europaea CBS 101466]
MEGSKPEHYDVVVVGSGNAGFSAASAAKEHNHSLRVLVLEKAPSSWAGGNSTFTAGAYRTVFKGLEDVLPIVHNVTPDLAKRIDMTPYTEQDFMDDLQRVTGGRTDPHLANELVNQSNDTTKWLARNGIKFRLSFERQAYEIEGRFKFWGGMVLNVVDGGKGLTLQHQTNAVKRGIEVRYESPVVGLIRSDVDEVLGVTVRSSSGSTYPILATGGVILCAGGFEANASMRAANLGPGWDKAYVRGTPHNTGEMLKMAIDAGAKAVGNWSGCHSTCWDANAPTDAGDQQLTNQFTKSGYPLGLMINTDGDRFVDEGLDMRNYTYAKFGRAILQQPNGLAFQVWDATGTGWLRKEEYAPDVVERISADSIQDLAKNLTARGLSRPETFVRTIEEYNQAVSAHRQENPSVIFDPSKKDGLSTRSSKGGLELDKTNWALPLTKAPFLAVKVTCGVTFTFGGVKADPKTAAVVSEYNEQAIPGLFVAGEMLGGLFYDNYPGGSGLTSGAVFGRKAGRAAAERASEKKTSAKL